LEGGVSEEGVFEGGGELGLLASGVVEAGVLDEVNADWGTDFNAILRTSTVSKRSEAKREIAKSRVCSFSRAAFRCRFKKSA
jgi:hypothetical protein